MKLTIKNRILMSEIMPEKGNMLEMILQESILSKVKITPQDIEKYKIKAGENGTIEWDGNIDTGEEFKFEESEVKFLKDQYARLDHEGNINKRIFELCKIIMDLQ